MEAYATPGCRTRDLPDSYFGVIPSAALDFDSADLRSASIPSKRHTEARVRAKKHSASATNDPYQAPIISLRKYEGNGSKRGWLLASHDADADVEVHQSVCLNLQSSTSAEAELWILPNLEDWEMSVHSAQDDADRQQSEWAPLVERAVSSNRERLRRRLEGDGWDFVGGKYGEDGKLMEEENGFGCEGSVDEEFDVVVLDAS